MERLKESIAGLARRGGEERLDKVRRNKGLLLFECASLKPELNCKSAM